MKYMVTVINAAGIYIEHKTFNEIEDAQKHAKNFAPYCIIEIWKLVSDNLED